MFFYLLNISPNKIQCPVWVKKFSGACCVFVQGFTMPTGVWNLHSCTLFLFRFDSQAWGKSAIVLLFWSDWGFIIHMQIFHYHTSCICPAMQYTEEVFCYREEIKNITLLQELVVSPIATSLSKYCAFLFYLNGASPKFIVKPLQNLPYVTLII